jgi:hypothetical protein
MTCVTYTQDLVIQRVTKLANLYNFWGTICVTKLHRVNVNPDFLKGNQVMKLIVRIFALSVVVAGAAAASVSSSTPRNFTSHQAVAAGMPVPICPPDKGCPSPK